MSTPSSFLCESVLAAEGPAAAVLVALGEGPDIAVGRRPVIVGRHPRCDVRLDSIRVSRRHCCLVEDAGTIVVRDLGSTNGVRINDQLVDFGRLRPGDELSIAHIPYRFQTATGAGPGAPKTLLTPPPDV